MGSSTNKSSKDHAKLIIDNYLKHQTLFNNDLIKIDSATGQVITDDQPFLQSYSSFIAESAQRETQESCTASSS